MIIFWQEIFIVYSLDWVTNLQPSVQTQLPPDLVNTVLSDSHVHSLIFSMDVLGLITEFNNWKDGRAHKIKNIYFSGPLRKVCQPLPFISVEDKWISTNTTQGTHSGNWIFNNFVLVSFTVICLTLLRIK